MTPLALGFRKLLLRNIPDLTPEELDRYDSVLALRGDYIYQAQIDKLPEQDDNSDEFDVSGEDMIRKYDKIDPKGSRDPRTRQQSIFELVRAIAVTSDEAQEAIRPFRARFEALHRLWMARRAVAVQQGNLLQIPSTFPGLANFIRAVLNYQVVQVQTFVILTWEAIKDFFKDKRKRLAFLFILFLIVVCFLILWFPRQG